MSLARFPALAANQAAVVLALSLIPLLPLASHAQVIDFACPWRAYRVGASPVMAFAGRVNSDTARAFVTANSGDSTVSIVYLDAQRNVVKQESRRTPAAPLAARR